MALQQSNGISLSILLFRNKEASPAKGNLLTTMIPMTMVPMTMILLTKILMTMLVMTMN